MDDDACPHTSFLEQTFELLKRTFDHQGISLKEYFVCHKDKTGFCDASRSLLWVFDPDTRNAHENIVVPTMIRYSRPERGHYRAATDFGTSPWRLVVNARRINTSDDYQYYDFGLFRIVGHDANFVYLKRASNIEIY